LRAKELSFAVYLGTFRFIVPREAEK